MEELTAPLEEKGGGEEGKTERERESWQKREQVPSVCLALNKSSVAEMRTVWRQYTWAEKWGLCPFWGEAGSLSNTNVAYRPRPTFVYQVARDPSSRLATAYSRHGPKSGGAAVPPLGRPGSPSNTLSRWPRPTSVWSQQTWAKNWGSAFPFSGEGVVTI